MVTALSLLCLFASSTIPWAQVPFLFFSSAVMCVLSSKRAYLMAICAYLATALLAFLILPEKTTALLFALLLGHYGIFHSILQERMKSIVFRILLRLLYCDVFAGLGIYILYRVMLQTIHLPAGVPVWAIVLIAQGAFILYDLLYAGFVAIYTARFQRLIVPRR
jgi:hypothetical protein